MHMPLPMARSEEKTIVHCLDCARCCTYVAVGINAPTRPKHATEILWFLYHDKTSVYVDGDGEWCVQFESRCRNLQSDNLCAIYGVRPHICRTFDENTCEVNSQEGVSSHTFRTPEEFLAHLQQHYPKVYRQIERSHTVAEHRPAPRARQSSR